MSDWRAGVIPVTVEEGFWPQLANPGGVSHKYMDMYGYLRILYMDMYGYLRILFDKYI